MLTSSQFAGLIYTGTGLRTAVLEGLQRLVTLAPNPSKSWRTSPRLCLNVAIWIGVLLGFRANTSKQRSQLEGFGCVGDLQPRLRLLENPYGIKGATRLLEAWEARCDVETKRSSFSSFVCQAAGKPKGLGTEVLALAAVIKR